MAKRFATWDTTKPDDLQDHSQIVEVPTDPLEFDYHTQEDYASMYDYYRPSDYELELYEQAKAKLTQRQREVLDLHLQGLKQQEIADRLGVNQACVFKHLYGNIDYSNGGKVYGGVIKKLRKEVRRLQKEQTNNDK